MTKEWDIHVLKLHKTAIVGIISTLDLMRHKAQEEFLPTSCEYVFLQAINELESVQHIIGLKIREMEKK